MKILRKNIRNLRNVLNNQDFFDMPISSQFRFMVITNVNILDTEITKLMDFDYSLEITSTDRHFDYDKKRKEILDKFQVSTIDDFQAMSPDIAESFEEKIKALKEEYKDVVDSLELTKEKENIFYNSLVEIPLKTINVKDVPVISELVGDSHWAVWNTLMPLVVE